MIWKSKFGAERVVVHVCHCHQYFCWLNRCSNISDNNGTSTDICPVYVLSYFILIRIIIIVIITAKKGRKRRCNTLKIHINIFWMDTLNGRTFRQWTCKLPVDAICQSNMTPGGSDIYIYFSIRVCVDLLPTGHIFDGMSSP